MIPLNFYRDDNYVYYNNPNGITKKMSIADFEDMLNGSGGDLPEHSSSNQGDVLSVDANGGLVWKTLPPQSDEIFIVHKLYNTETSIYSLDKTFTEICNAISDGKLVITFESFEEDNTFYGAVTGIINNAFLDEDTNTNTVEIFGSNYYTVFINRYVETDGVLIFGGESQLPPPLYQSFTYMGNTLSATGKAVYEALASKYCYFANGSIGTNKEQRFTATQYGKDGSTYYVVLSNGDRFEGGETGNMTKVTVNP